MEIDEKAKVISDGVKYRARRRYLEGRFDNPYGNGEMDGLFIVDPIRKGMWELYHLEMQEHLRYPNRCPQCGQPCNGDFDW